jgi:hypothetical protein
VVDTKQQGDIIILVKLLIEKLVLNVISAYVPQIGLGESMTKAGDTGTMVVTPPPLSKNG